MARARKRSRGEVEKLPSGALRVKVYAGEDALTGRRHFLRETVPPGPGAAREAERVKARLLTQVDEGRNPRTQATVNQLMDRYLEVLEVDATTRTSYEGYIRNHVRPLLGKITLAKLNGETLDSFYSILRTCRAHCHGRRFVEHRVSGPHECDVRCRQHVCRPLANSSIRQIHFCLSGGLKRAVRWRWITVNPLEQAEPPRASKHDVEPPTSAQAAAILNAAFADLRWGTLLWLAMTTGARRGELCALRWDLLDLDQAVLAIRTSIAQEGGKTWEKATKTHQQRRIVLDDATSACCAPTAGSARTRPHPSASSSCPAAGSSPLIWTTRAGRSRTRSRSATSGCARAWAGTCTCTSCGTTRRPSSSPRASTSAPWPAGSATAGAARRRCGSTRPGSPRPTRRPPAR